MIIRKKSHASLLLDLTRGIAAVLVAIGHWRNLLFVDYPHLVAHRFAAAPFYILTSVGHQAVIIFFVLSGYLVGGSVLHAIRRGTWSWTTYLGHRLTRLWVVLIPGLLFGLLCDQTRLYYERTRHIIRALSSEDVTIAPHGLGIKVFLANVFFLQGVHAPVYGSNGSLWSLANEFWYYLLFPLGLLTVSRGSRLPVRILCGSLFILIAFFLWGRVLYQFPIWLAGALLAVLPALRLRKFVYVVATLLYLPQVFYFSKRNPFALSPRDADYLFTCSTFLFLWILLSVTGDERASATNRVIRTLAGFSFTIYVVHLPALALMASVFGAAQRWVPSIPHLVEGLALLCPVLAYAYGAAVLTEFRTETWRLRIERHLAFRNRIAALRRVAAKRFQRSV